MHLRYALLMCHLCCLQLPLLPCHRQLPVQHTPDSELLLPSELKSYNQRTSAATFRMPLTLNALKCGSAQADKSGRGNWTGRGQERGPLKAYRRWNARGINTRRYRACIEEPATSTCHGNQRVERGENAKMACKRGRASDTRTTLGNL